MELEGEEFADKDGEVDRGAEESLVSHHRHGGGAAEQVADGKVEQQRGAVVVQPSRPVDHQYSSQLPTKEYNFPNSPSYL